jgi:hypothetical protein
MKEPNRKMYLDDDDKLDDNGEGKKTRRFGIR